MGMVNMITPMQNLKQKLNQMQSLRLSQKQKLRLNPNPNQNQNLSLRLNQILKQNLNQRLNQKVNLSLIQKLRLKLNPKLNLRLRLNLKQSQRKKISLKWPKWSLDWHTPLLQREKDNPRMHKLLLHNQLKTIGIQPTIWQAEQL